MDSLPIAMIRSARLMDLEAYSARPDAPVVPDVERPHHPVRRSRTAAAAGLYRLADLLAPARPVRPIRETSTLGC
jgi:hypothetical protein